MEQTDNKENNASPTRASNGMDRSEIKQLVSDLLSSLGFSGASIEVTEGARTVVKIASPENTTLIGPGGETLRALNHLARRIAENKAKDTQVSFVIDVGNHLEAELEVIRGSARTLAQRARLFKHDVELEPMTAYERLVIHELFQDDPEIKTESAGEGKFRRVVLKYVEKTNSI